MGCAADMQKEEVKLVEVSKMKTEGRSFKSSDNEHIWQI